VIEAVAGSTESTVYCGVAIISAVFGGLNVMLGTYLARDRRRADRRKRAQHETVMRRMDQLQDMCPVFRLDQPKEE